MIENKTVPCESLYIRGLNYGQDDHHLPVTNYSITTPLVTLAMALSKYYEDFARDDQIYGSDSDNEEEIVRIFRSKGWPPLAQLAIHEPMLVRDFVELVSYDALMALFPSEIDDKQLRYIINSVDDVQLEEEKIRFSGKALDLRQK